jgi:hypothetical protein
LADLVRGFPFSPVPAARSSPRKTMAAATPHHNDVFLARNGFIRPNKKLWKKSTEHRVRPACSRCNFRGHSADECKVRRAFFFAVLCSGCGGRQNDALLARARTHAIAAPSGLYAKKLEEGRACSRQAQWLVVSRLGVAAAQPASATRKR